MEQKQFVIRILKVVAVIILIVGLIWVGFTAVEMVNKWIGRKAQAEGAKQMVGGISRILPGFPGRK